MDTRASKQSAALNEPTNQDEDKEPEKPPKKTSESSSRRARKAMKADAAMLKKLGEQGNKKKLKDLENFNSEKKKKKQAEKAKKAEQKKLEKLAKLAKHTAAKDKNDSENEIQPLLADSMPDVSSSNASKTVTTKKRRHTRASGQSEHQVLVGEVLENEDEEDLMELRDPKKRRSVRLAAQKLKKEEEKKQEENEEEEDQVEGEDEMINGINMAHCQKVIASIQFEKREPGKAISDEAFDKLFFAFCPGDTKKYDSDDSIISEIDWMSDGEIARRDAAFLQTMAEIRAIPRRQRRLETLHNMWKTKEGREALRKTRWNKRHRNLSKKQRKELEERRLRRQKELKEKMEEVIPFHPAPDESESGEFRMHLTRRQFAFCLETLSELIQTEVEPATSSHMQDVVELVSDEKLQEALRFMGIGAFFGKRFFEEKNALAKIVKELLKEILSNEKITGIFEKEENGFQFGTFQAVLALADFYSLENTLMEDLDIKMKFLVQACWNTDRRTTGKAETNALITYCVADDIGQVE